MLLLLVRTAFLALPASFSWTALADCDWLPRFQGLCASANLALAIAQAAQYSLCVRGIDGSISAQDLLDCAITNYDQKACQRQDTSSIERAKLYLERTGLPSGSDYPFNVTNYYMQECRTESRNRTKFVLEPVEGDSTAIKNALIKEGPLVMLLQDTDDLNYYDGDYRGDGLKLEQQRAFVVVGWASRGLGSEWVGLGTLGSGWGLGGKVRVETSHPSVKGFLRVRSASGQNSDAMS